MRTRAFVFRGLRVLIALKYLLRSNPLCEDRRSHHQTPRQVFLNMTQHHQTRTYVSYFPMLNHYWAHKQCTINYLVSQRRLNWLICNRWKLQEILKVIDYQSPKQGMNEN